MATLRPASIRCACIDIGSNTTRLLVADVADGRLDAVVQQRSFTRIGRAIGVDGAIPAAMIADVADVVARQRDVAEVAGAERLHVVGTAAIRRAANRAALLAALRERAGVDVDVVPGEREARLAFLGATRTLPAPPPGTIAVVDVGGMSTEIAIGTMAAGVTWARSYAIGSAALAAACAGDPPSPADVAAMRAAARAAFALPDVPRCAQAVAVGGSAASLPTIVGPVVDAGALERALAILTSASAAEVARLHDLAPERTQLLPAGILVLGAAAERLSRPLRIGRGGLREGVILELAARP
jgi:exopolyphosphatase / guanosine-5'-triphosphate,3'-diphosphate pyrophosphatase